MEVERQPVAEEIVEYCQKRAPGVEFAIEGQRSLLNKRMWLFLVVAELALNCAEAGAKTVKIEIDEGKLTVKDDAVHKNPEEILSRINLPLPESTKNRPGKGEGIWNIRQTLARHNGKLEHHPENGRIIAVATWEE